MMGLRLGEPGARRWRQVWSDHRLRALPAHDVMLHARRATTPTREFKRQSNPQSSLEPRLRDSQARDTN